MAPKQDVTNSFNKEEGVIHIGGIDALVRLTLDQVRTDARRGLKTGMFVSGYRGSPVGMLDAALLKQQKMLVEHNIKFVDGINEDLAATAVWGTQMLHACGRQKFDGVTGMWYGKAPGVDRSGDALKHANYTGIDKNGGVLALVGDDPSCKSSSLCSQSEPMLFHARHAVALSRQRAGDSRPGPARLPHVAPFGAVGWHEDRHQCRRRHPAAPMSRPNGSTFVTPDLTFDGKPFTPHMTWA